MTYLERRRTAHQHRFFLDSNTQDEVCLCGKLKGEREKKYKNRMTEFRGALFDSQFEANYAAELEIKRRGGLIKKWERQGNIDLRSYGKHVCFYKCDFRITHNDGSVEYVETKGKWTDAARLKWKLFEI